MQDGKNTILDNIFENFNYNEVFQSHNVLVIQQDFVFNDNKNKIYIYKIVDANRLLHDTNEVQSNIFRSFNSIEMCESSANSGGISLQEIRNPCKQFTRPTSKNLSSTIEKSKDFEVSNFKKNLNIASYHMPIQVKYLMFVIIISSLTLLIIGLVEVFISNYSIDLFLNYIDLWKVSKNFNLYITSIQMYFLQLAIKDNYFVGNDKKSIKAQIWLTSEERRVIVNKLNYDISKIILLNNQFLFKINHKTDSNLYNLFYNTDISISVLDFENSNFNRSSTNSNNKIAINEKLIHLTSDLIIKVSDLIKNPYTSILGLYDKADLLYHSIYSNDKKKVNSLLARNMFYFIENSFRGLRLMIENINTIINNILEDIGNTEINLIRNYISYTPFLISTIGFIIICYILKIISDLKMKILKSFLRIQPRDCSEILRRCNEYLKNYLNYYNSIIYEDLKKIKNNLKLTTVNKDNLMSKIDLKIPKIESGEKKRSSFFTKSVKSTENILHSYNYLGNDKNTEVKKQSVKNEKTDGLKRAFSIIPEIMESKKSFAVYDEKDSGTDYINNSNNPNAKIDRDKNQSSMFNTKKDHFFNTDNQLQNIDSDIKKKNISYR